MEIRKVILILQGAGKAITHIIFVFSESTLKNKSLKKLER